MKRLLLSAAAVTAVFIVLAVLWLAAVPGYNEKRIRARSVTVNRLNSQLEAAVAEGRAPEEAAGMLISAGDRTMPDSITFVSADEYSGDNLFTATGSGGTMICPVRSNGQLEGFAVYSFSDPFRQLSDTLVLAVLAVCWAFTLVMLAAVHIKILRPFNRLSDYPERLARIPDSDKLPETKDRRFGKFVWSMNMLGDVLRNERNRAERLECQRQTLLASIAHGIKTPVANIRLYTEAIRTGLYSGSEGGDSALAEKIDNNAEKIQTLIKELITASSSAASSYVPEISQFYLSELQELIIREYSEKMKLLRIPFTVECTSDRLMKTDIYGLLRIVSQLIENAVKYGSGEGIRISLDSDMDSACISVRNKGELLPEEELTYIFDSFRRGSNSKDIEGNGIGLFTARSIASALGGNIWARRHEETSEMEFVVLLGD